MTGTGSPQPVIASAGARAWLRSPWTWLLVIMSVAYLPMFLGQVIFFRDPAHWNYPARWFFRASLLRGEFPSWNPDQGLGFSVFGNPLYSVFYPPNWLFLLGSDEWVAGMLTWQSFGHMVWGSAGVLLLSRRLGASSLGGLVAAVAWGLNGHTTAMWTAGLLLLAGAWVPWIALGFLALARALRDGQQPFTLGLVKAAVPIAMAVLLGEVFIAMIGIGFGITLTLLATLARRGASDAQMGAAPASPPNWRWVVALVAAPVLGGMVGTVVILPARAIAATTERAFPLIRVLAEACSLHPLRLVEFVAPGSMGYAYESYPAARIVGEPLLSGLPLSFSVYMGAATVALALLAFGRGRRLPVLLAALALLVLVISFGRHTPVHNWLRTVVRPLAYMRYPEKYVVLLVACVAVLAGLGTTRMFSGRPQPWRRTVGFLALLVLLGTLAGALFPPDLAPSIRQGALLGVAAVLGVLAAQYLAPRRPRASAAILILCVACDLAAAAWPLQGFGPRGIATAVPPAAAAIQRDFGRRIERPRLYRSEKVEDSVPRWVRATSNPEGEHRSMQTLIHNTVATFGIGTLPGYDAAIPTPLRAVWLSGEKTGQSVLRLLGINYAILPIDEPADRTERRVGIEPMMDPLPGARLYRVPGTLPRVYLAGRAEVLSDEYALRRVFDADVLTGGKVLLAPDAAVPPAALDGVAARAGECRLASFANARIVAHCRADREAIAVFLEQSDLGWRAEVDGHAAPLHRANLMVRGVRLGPGEHTIVLSYHPPALAAGIVGSGLAIASLTGLGLAGLLRRRREQGEPAKA